MSQIMKTFLGVFLILAMVATSVGILVSLLQVTEAQNIHASMINEIEDSDFYPQVIAECFDIAQEKGYSLNITFYESDNSQISCSNKSQVPANIDAIMARVELKFDSLLQYFGADSEHWLDGYAR